MVWWKTQMQTYPTHTTESEVNQDEPTSNCELVPSDEQHEQPKASVKMELGDGKNFKTSEIEKIIGSSTDFKQFDELQ
jgi:hypothetical protein